MSLLDEVAGLLTGRGIEVAVIGAAALAAHGVSRATAHLDQLLNVDPGIAAQVEAGLGTLPADCADLWRSILDRRRRS